MSHIFHGKRRPGWVALCKMCAYLELDVTVMSNLMWGRKPGGA